MSDKIVSSEGIRNDEGSFLKSLMEMKPLELPKCKCGATVGLCFKYDRWWWCFDCVWALVNQQQTVIEAKR